MAARAWRREPKRQILILGLGHIGASLAARLAREGWGVWGWDKDPVALAHSRRRGWIYHVAGAESVPGPAAKLCVVALPERAVESAELVAMLAGLSRGTIVTDVFSSKGAATRRLAERCKALGLRYVWSHPLAGREGSGAASADPEIFQQATVIVDSKARAADRRAVVSFWRGLGCEIELMSADEHQKSMARGSHLMHVLAFAAARVVAEGGRVSPSVLSATRVACSSPEAWAEILRSNGDELAQAIGHFERELKAVSKLLRVSKPDRLRDYLSQARKLRLKMENRS